MTRDSAIQARTAGHKSVGLALVFSALLPGAGQGYNRQWLKAGAMFGGAIASYVALQLGGTRESVSCFVFSCKTTTVLACDICAVSFLGFYLWSLIDAPIAAASINRRLDHQRQVTVEVGLRPVLLFPRSHAPALGFSVALVRF